MLEKQFWNIISQSTAWLAQVYSNKYLKKKDIFSCKASSTASWGWNNLLCCQGTTLTEATWQVGRDHKISLQDSYWPQIWREDIRECRENKWRVRNILDRHTLQWNTGKYSSYMTMSKLSKFSKCQSLWHRQRTHWFGLMLTWVTTQWGKAMKNVIWATNFTLAWGSCKGKSGRWLERNQFCIKFKCKNCKSELKLRLCSMDKVANKGCSFTFLINQYEI